MGLGGVNEALRKAPACYRAMLVGCADTLSRPSNISQDQHYRDGHSHIFIDIVHNAYYLLIYRLVYVYMTLLNSAI